MANLNGDNYAAQYVTKPSEKIAAGEFMGKPNVIIERYTMAQVIAVNDLILGPKLPAGSVVLDAKIRIDKSLGATGIFDLGNLASADAVEAADSDAFVKAADAGGQAVLQRANELCVGIHKRYESEVQIAAICTEVTDGTVLDGIITFEVEYANS